MGDHDPTISSSPSTTTATVSAKFREAATALATELELDVDLVIKRVLEKKLVSTASDKAAAALTKVPDAKFAEAFSEKSEAEVAMATEAMRAALNPKPVAPATGTPTDADSGAAFQVLPKLLTEQLLVDALKTGGVAKVGAAHVEALVRVYGAEMTGVFGIPRLLEELITQRFKDLNEPASQGLRRLRKQIRRQRHSTLLADLLKNDDDASAVTREEQEELLSNAYTILIPKLAEFAKLLLAWEQRASDTGSLTASALANVLASPTNTARARLAARKTNNLNTTLIKNAIGDVNDAVNKTFRGLGIEAAVALYDEARFCTSLITNNDVLALVGKTTHEEVKAALRIEVSNASQQLEFELAQFVVAIMNYPKTASPEYEVGYLCEMLPLAENIPWDTLPKTRSRSGFGASPYSGNGGNNAMDPGGVGSNGRRGANSRDGIR